MKKCKSCGEEMDYLAIWQNGEPVFEQELCPKCHEPELLRITGDDWAHQLRMRLLPQGAIRLE